MDPSAPLTDEELDELDAFLMSDAVGDEAMDISMLDGFLTALAIGPRTLPPAEWLPLVWGADVAWRSEAQARRMTDFVFRHANDLLFYFRDQPEEFEPLLYERDMDGKPVPVIDEWCIGFVKGMALDEEGWNPLMESEEGEELLLPIMLYGTEEGWERLRDNPMLEERHQEFVEMLGDCVMAIHQWWLPFRKQGATLRREEPKVGRNELCPCGSGKKFKRCCGAPDKVVH